MRVWAVRLAVVVVFWGLILQGTWFLASLYPPQHPLPVCEDSQRGNGSQEDCNETPESLGAMFLDWLGEADNIIAFFTIVLGIGTIVLILDGRKHSERELRAYVLPIQATVHEQADGSAIFAMDGANVGQTPAHDLTMWMGIRVRPLTEAIAVGSRPADLRVGKAVIGPTNPVHLEGPRSAGDWLLIKNGERLGWMVGDIQYRDIFGTAHRTTFKFVVGGEYGLSDENGAMSVARDDNTAD